MHILFVCRGNVFRSLTAETYLRSLDLPNVTASSCGTNVDSSLPQERIYFNNTLELLGRHGIRQFAKDQSHELTQQEVDKSDVVVLVNQRAADEASAQVTLPDSTVVWHIVDIGEGDRIATETNRVELEELIYGELTEAVDELVSRFKLSQQA
jgi:protein-tyrosine-phosphatase